MREGVGLYPLLNPASLITAINSFYHYTCWRTGIDTAYLCLRNCHFHLDC